MNKYYWCKGTNSFTLSQTFAEYVDFVLVFSHTFHPPFPKNRPPAGNRVPADGKNMRRKND